VRATPFFVSALLLAGCMGDDDESAETQSPLRTQQIAFSSNRDGDFDIYSMRPDGSGVVNLTQNTPNGRKEADDSDPAWSPNGRMIAFTSTRDHEGDSVSQQEIYVMGADGSDQRRLTENSLADFAPEWFADGRIVFWRCRQGTSDCALTAIRPDGDSEESLHKTDDSVYGVSPSPDGRKVAYAQANVAAAPANSEIYVVDVETGKETRLTDSPGVEGIGPWSPDGSKLLFDTDRDKHGACLFHDCVGNASEIYVMNADGSGERRLTETTEQELFATWSPGGERILFARIRNEDDDYELYVMNADGSCAERVTENEAWDWMADWYGPRSAPRRPLDC
jgi:Tol biopolymer transport system component